MSVCPMQGSSNQVSFNWGLSCMGCNGFPPHHRYLFGLTDTGCYLLSYVHILAESLG